MVIVNAKARITDGTLGVTTRKAQVVGVILTTNKHSIRADYVKSNCYDYYIEGCPPQNEEGTLDACEILVNYLNQLTDQPTFLSPYVVSHKYLDALAQRVDKNQQPLSIQVVRAVASDKFWHALAKQKIFSKVYNLTKASELLVEAINKKLGIPEENRSEIVLLLDAVTTPFLSFRGIIDNFIQQYTKWMLQLGFQEIWIVGPSPTMTHRLV